MQTDHLQTIQNLVKTAPILSAAEKEDWVELMDLMSDHQLLELERILTDAKKSGQAPVVPLRARPDILPKMAGVTSLPFGAPPVKPVSAISKPVPIEAPKQPAPAGPPVKPVVAPAQVPAAVKPSSTKEPEVHLPPFGHILNFPAGSSMPKIFPPKVNSKDVQQRSQSLFMRKLKNILSEKELPPADIKDLPSGVPPVVAKPVVSTPPVPKPPVPKPPEKPNVTINVFLNEKGETVKPAGQVPAAAPAPAKPGVPAERTDVTFSLPSKDTQVSYGGEKSDSSTVVIKIPKKTDDSGVTPGLNFPGFSDKASVKAKTGAGAGGIIIEEEEVRPNIIPKVVLEERAGDSVKLDSLSDVAGLKPEDLQSHATGTIFKKLRGLMGQFGYYQVLFSLEKSPLYRSYLISGIQKMGAGIADGQVGAVLEQKDFERFADLLIVMQS